MHDKSKSRHKKKRHHACVDVEGMVMQGFEVQIGHDGKKSWQGKDNLKIKVGLHRYAKVSDRRGARGPKEIME